MTTDTTIYIVDDDEGVRESLGLLLTVSGCAVRAYESGEAILSAPPATASGCLILDYHMPAGNGLDLLDQLRALEITLPAILITGRPDARIVQRADDAGVLATLAKPFTERELLDAVDSALTATTAPARCASVAAA
jgi:two-component system response regulator FixJ